jgi:hypothetical protein
MSFDKWCVSEVHAPTKTWFFLYLLLPLVDFGDHWQGRRWQTIGGREKHTGEAMEHRTPKCGVVRDTVKSREARMQHFFPSALRTQIFPTQEGNKHIPAHTSGFA